MTGERIKFERVKRGGRNLKCQLPDAEVANFTGFDSHVALRREQPLFLTKPLPGWACAVLSARHFRSKLTLMLP